MRTTGNGPLPSGTPASRRRVSLLAFPYSMSLISPARTGGAPRPLTVGGGRASGLVAISSDGAVLLIAGNPASLRADSVFWTRTWVAQYQPPTANITEARITTPAQ